MALSQILLEVLACPLDKGPLLYSEEESFLYNPRLKRKYGIVDDIPVLLVEESEVVDDHEHERLLSLFHQ
ncbi:MAG: Trm112 family protein [Acidimicrobiales bacterium]